MIQQRTALQTMYIIMTLKSALMAQKQRSVIMDAVQQIPERNLEQLLKVVDLLAAVEVGFLLCSIQIFLKVMVILHL